MGYLTVYSEDKCPHSGCIFEYGDGRSEWLSFMPKIITIFDVFPGNTGWIDDNNRERNISSYARFRIDDATLNEGRKITVEKYQSSTYSLFISDCVSFSRDMSLNCLLTTQVTAFSPENLVINLKNFNQAKLTHTNTKPFPWRTIHKKKSAAE